MAIVFSRNKISIEEYERVITNNDWVRVETDLPECFRGIPQEKLVAVFASGSNIATRSAGLVFGMDVIRSDPNDIDRGGRYNIDHYDGYLTSSNDRTHYIALTRRITQADHWCNEIPEVYRSAITVSFRKRE